MKLIFAIFQHFMLVATFQHNGRGLPKTPAGVFTIYGFYLVFLILREIPLLQGPEEGGIALLAMDSLIPLLFIYILKPNYEAISAYMLILAVSALTDALFDFSGPILLLYMLAMGISVGYKMKRAKEK